MLTTDEIERYHRDGYVIPAGFQLSPSELSEARAALDHVLEGNPEILPDRLINVHLDGGNPYGVRGHSAFRQLALDSRILDMAEALVGPDLVLLFAQLFCKPAESSRQVPWHQDGEYWPVRPLASCTAWLALDDVDDGNGAMRVIPGSHRGTMLRHDAKDDEDLTLKYVITEDQFDESSAQSIELKAGQVSLHDIGIIHGSAANTSGRRRAGYAMRYMPATSLVDRTIQPAAAGANWSDLPCELVRGANRHSGNDFTLGDFGEPWPDV
jgi:hypothetical protein